MREPNRSLRICHTILDSLNMTDLRQIVTFEGDWRKTNKVNQAGLTVSDGSFRCGGFVMQCRVDISTIRPFLDTLFVIFVSGLTRYIFPNSLWIAFVDVFSDAPLQ